MSGKISSYALVFRDLKHTLETLSSKRFEKERLSAKIIKTVHSIEKGLCIENLRLGFGYSKLNNLFSLCGRFAERFGYDGFCLKMARDAVGAYIDFHKSQGYVSEEFSKICELYDGFGFTASEEGEVYGGALDVDHGSNLSIEQLEEFFKSRHSVRAFSDEAVAEDEIIRAVAAAQLAPSACNRQAVRAYVLPSEKICELYKQDLSGIGGFAENANKFIFVTGKLSAYDRSEHNQYIVSASIFATYLIEALHAEGIGACMVQRPLHYSTQWSEIAHQVGIPDDERLVLMIAVGKMKKNYKAPVSKRLPTEEIVKFVD